MLRFRSLTALLLLLTVATACAPDPGNVRLDVDWGKLKPDKEVYLWLRVEERPNAGEAGVTLSSAGPETYSPDLPLNVPLDVPHGNDRVVIVEVRESPSSSQLITYYGISDPFDFHTGDDVVVDVPIKIAETEAIGIDAEFLLVGFEQVILASKPKPEVSFPPISLDQLRNVTFRSRTAGAVSIVLSSVSSFEGAVVYYMSDPDSPMNCEPAQDGEGDQKECEVPELDLSSGVPDPPDGQYTLFVKLLDRYGYESPVYELSVFLDSAPPSPELAALIPTVIKGGESAVLTVTFAEELLDFPENPGLITDPLKGLTFEAGERIGESNTYRWVFTATTESVDSEPFTFKVQAKDLVGNQTDYEDVEDTDGNPLELTVD
jgi:hypothetical protein